MNLVKVGSQKDICVLIFRCNLIFIGMACILPQIIDLRQFFVDLEGILTVFAGLQAYLQRYFCGILAGLQMASEVYKILDIRCRIWLLLASNYKNINRICKDSATYCKNDVF